MVLRPALSLHGRLRGVCSGIDRFGRQQPQFLQSRVRSCFAKDRYLRRSSNDVLGIGHGLAIHEATLLKNPTTWPIVNVCPPFYTIESTFIGRRYTVKQFRYYGAESLCSVAFAGMVLRLLPPPEVQGWDGVPGWII